jgi:hypothetical protein
MWLIITILVAVWWAMAWVSYLIGAAGRSTGGCEPGAKCGWASGRLRFHCQIHSVIRYRLACSSVCVEN